ncbi:exo-alpha-sialidase [Trypanosoma cruzi]|nr:exo-alpha-sialidase [Trypanosoma cruzi]
MKGRGEGARTASHSSCGCDAPPLTAVEGRFSSVCASPPLCRALAHVICYARACWACFSGALGGRHLSMAVCVSGHVRIGVRAHGMKEWRAERGIWFGGYLDRIHLAAVVACTTDVFPHNGVDATGFSEVARQCNSGFIALGHSGLPAMAGDGP